MALIPFAWYAQVLCLAVHTTGTKSLMPTDRSARRVLSIAMGIAAIFDLTGMTVYATMRPVLPPSPPRQDDRDDPFRSAMSTITAAHREAAGRARDESGETLIA
jgi:hypothetical protein